MYEPDYYNCSPCDFETPSCEEYGYRWDSINLEYVRIEDDEEEHLNAISR